MILSEHRHHQPSSVESTDNEVRLSNKVASCQPTDNSKKKIEEAVVVHQQPDGNQKVAEVGNDHDDADDEEDSSTYPSSDDEEDDDENKQSWLAERLPGMPQPSVNNHVTNSNKVNINNTNKNVYEGNVVIHQTFYNNLTDLAGNTNVIDVLSTKKITIDKDTEAAVGPRLSNVSSHSSYPFTQDQVTSWCTKKRLIVISAAILAGITIISLIVYLPTSVPTFHDVCIVPRREWLAQSAKEDAKPLAVSPAKYVIIIPTKTAKCFTQSQCSGVVRDMQVGDMDKLNKTDIGYNWLVGGDGLVYECRGWDAEGDHTKNYDNKSIGIGFIGIFNSELPSEAQIDKGQQLIKKGVEENKIAKDYVLVGRKQCTNSSDSSAEVLYDIIKKWNNWSPVCF